MTLTQKAVKNTVTFFALQLTRTVIVFPIFSQTAHESYTHCYTCNKIWRGKWNGFIYLAFLFLFWTILTGRDLPESLVCFYNSPYNSRLEYYNLDSLDIQAGIQLGIAAHMDVGKLQKSTHSMHHLVYDLS